MQTLLRAFQCDCFLMLVRYNGMAYNAASQRTAYKSDIRPRAAFNDSYKSQSVEGRQSNQIFNYV